MGDKALVEWKSDTAPGCLERLTHRSRGLFCAGAALVCHVIYSLPPHCHRLDDELGLRGVTLVSL